MISPESSSRFSPQAAAAAGWLGPWLAAAGLALWTAIPGGAPLILAAAGVTAAALWGRGGSRLWTLGTVVVVGGILAGFEAHRQGSSLRDDWPAYWAGREAAIGDQLDEELQRRLEAGEAAVAILADLGSEPAALPDARRLRELREEYALTAVALYDNDGDLRAWDGEHRGKVPDAVQWGLRQYVYEEQPLFGYLYITAPAGGAGTAVAAFLLRSDLPGRLGVNAPDFASRFRAEVGEQVRVFSAPLAEEQGGWELTIGDRVLLSVLLEPPRAADRIDRTMDRWRLGVAGVVLLGWLLLALGGPPRLASGAAASATLVFIVGVAPLHEFAWLAPLFDEAEFVLPGPLPVSLGRAALLLGAMVTFVSVLPRPRLRLSPPVVGGIMALAAPALLLWLRAGAAPPALAGGEAVWLIYQGVAGALVAIVLATALVFAKVPAPRRTSAIGALAVAVLLAGAGALLVWRAPSGVPPWWPALGGLPALLAARAVGGWSGWRRSVITWGLAGLVGSAVALPSAWSDRVEARRAEGASRLALLAAPADPTLEADLRRSAAVADSLDVRGDDGVDLLYHVLRRSGLAASGYPVWMTLWSAATVPQEELRVGVGPDRPAAADDAARDLSGTGPRLLTYDQSDARYVMRVPLRNARVLTVTAPPFSTLGARSPLAPLLAGGAPSGPEPLTLIPVGLDDEPGGTTLSWVPTERGWQGEIGVTYPDARFHAHWAVTLPGPLLAVARATLLAVLNTLVVLLFWVGGRALLRESLPPEARLRGLVISFQARVTLALFGFFVLANAIFGTVAYRTIDGASHRAAEVLAERVAEDAAGWYFEESGAMELLARRVGAELLEYRTGELREGSVEELVELGLYEGWIPYGVHETVRNGEAIRASEETVLGRWAYVTAYRRLPDGDVLAAQVPLQAGATAVRSSDVLQLLAFAVLMGGVLSLGLALLVGRTLTRPIQALQVASERVGAGNLALRLPAHRADEFGSVFQAFNRMVRRLRRARRQLVRQTRRTQAIMEEAAVGMVALDPGGRVTLVNPRAETVLGAAVALGEPLPRAGAMGAELGLWLDDYLRGEATEAGLELHDGDRRIRVRVRRLDATGAPGGVVLALEDVTDELRTERVLAWGEMARQVAHEVKNPLTPMKLSIQHIRRAWDDRREDFGDILVRNADAMLSEVDRLAAIATSFSRFGAPGGGGAGAVGPVDVSAVARDVLALYGAAEGDIRFRGDLDDGLPPVRSRVPELKEVLVNLLENARDAIKDGGEVVIGAGPDRDPGWVRLVVADDGAGMPEELTRRVFEPHFSTRSGGTGLGLAIVRRLVESWGGEVDLESAPGRGTRVTLRLRAMAGNGAGRGGDVGSLGTS